MDRDDLEILRQFIDKAVAGGWNPCHGSIQGTFVILDPACVRIAASSPSPHVDTDVYMDWLSPLHEAALAKAAWGTKLVGSPTFGYIENWKYHQHKLLDFLQTDARKSYFEYLDLAK